MQCIFFSPTKCMESRAVNPSAPGWQSWKSLQGLSQSVLSKEGLTCLCCFSSPAVTPAPAGPVWLLCVAIGSFKSIYL